MTAKKTTPARGVAQQSTADKAAATKAAATKAKAAAGSNGRPARADNAGAAKAAPTKTSTSARTATKPAKSTDAKPSRAGSAGKKSTAAKTTAAKTPATKTTATKSTARKAGKSTAANGQDHTGKAAAKGAPKTPAKRSTAKDATATERRSAGRTKRATEAEVQRLTRSLKVKDDESPWTTAELRAVGDFLRDEIESYEREIEQAERELVELIHTSGDGAGDDQADAGARTFEREHEIALANNSRDMLFQTERALERLRAGTYGICENCGNPIGKGRLQVFPRATLCMTCKTKQERH